MKKNTNFTKDWKEFNMDRLYTSDLVSYLKIILFGIDCKLSNLRETKSTFKSFYNVQYHIVPMQLDHKSSKRVLNSSKHVCRLYHFQFNYLFLYLQVILKYHNKE